MGNLTIHMTIIVRSRIRTMKRPPILISELDVRMGSRDRNFQLIFLKSGTKLPFSNSLNKFVDKKNPIITPLVLGRFPKKIPLNLL